MLIGDHHRQDLHPRGCLCLVDCPRPRPLKQGTYYAYFTPQFAEFGIDCQMLNWTNTYGKPDHPNHEKVVKKLKEGVLCHRLDEQGPLDIQRPLCRFVVAGQQGADQ